MQNCRHSSSVYVPSISLMYDPVPIYYLETPHEEPDGNPPGQLGAEVAMVVVAAAAVVVSVLEVSAAEDVVGTVEDVSSSVVAVSDVRIVVSIVAVLVIAVSVVRDVVPVVAVAAVAVAEVVDNSGRSQKQSKEYQEKSVLEPSVPWILPPQRSQKTFGCTAKAIQSSIPLQTSRQ